MYTYSRSTSLAVARIGEGKIVDETEPRSDRYIAQLRHRNTAIKRIAKRSEGDGLKAGRGY